MGRDKYKRAYLCEVECGGLPLVECDRVTGVNFSRGIFPHVDAEGNEIPLVGGKKMTTIELHGCNPSDKQFFDWYDSPDPERKSGAIHYKEQSGTIRQSVTFSDALPVEGSLDDHDRKTEDKHGATYKIACVVRSVN